MSSVAGRRAGGLLVVVALGGGVFVGACSTALRVGSQGPGPGSSDHEECGNGLDDDGDGTIDDGCWCGAGETQPCSTADVAKASQGACARGVLTCDAAGAEFGMWGDTCAGETAPRDEQCDGTDDDCDGAVDEGCACNVSESRGCGSVLPAPCTAGRQTCGADARWGPCEGLVVPQPERCGDGVDNDCDGTADELCDCTPVPEICEDMVDNDCDGTVDEPACRPLDGGAGDGGPPDTGPLDGGVGDTGPVDSGGVDTGLCPASPCYPVTPQCGCPDGEACRLVGGVPQCGVAGTAQEGEACGPGAGVNCDIGLSCWGFGGGAQCTPYCDAHAQCTGAPCFGGTVVGVCSHACDPIAQTGCDTGLDCELFFGTDVESDMPIGTSTCGTAGSLGLGAACPAGMRTQCMPGLACVNDACREICVVGGAPCSVGSCVSVAPQVMIGGQEYGVCLGGSG